ncbi:uncharacterized protein N7484_002511 [Penicillium longicatenatum]|uniref:uncharacterized protein n=1 Tax=Penicillium longicatenatum TaxID=1561947 RepID=UPI002546E0BE|nr:uncharacterized protein N7484_002511 [Penicillium longicatenatum]KAJ5658862.1 hypothetical protein N7484_002511 [Penicillium longicatenatum]
MVNPENGLPVGQENINTNIVTLSRFLPKEQTKYPEAPGDFTLLCHALQFSFKSIAYYIRRAPLINLTGLLDVISNDIFISAMRGSGKCRILISEEEENLIKFGEYPNASYAVVCDSINGSSNLDASVSVGTIFGIFQLPKELLGAGKEVGPTLFYILLIITVRGGGVNGFTLENSLGEFILTHPNMRIPNSRAIHSVNEVVSSLILYECAPMAMVFENAGGLAVNSRMEPLMGFILEHIHDKSGVFLVSKKEVHKVIDMYHKYKK